MKSLIKKLALGSAIFAGAAGLSGKAEAEPPFVPAIRQPAGYITMPVTGTMVVPTVPRVVATGPYVPYIHSVTGPLGLFTWTHVDWFAPAAIVQVPDWRRARIIYNQPVIFSQCLPQPCAPQQYAIPQPAYTLPQFMHH